jgi:hypothetical protein
MRHKTSCPYWSGSINYIYKALSQFVGFIFSQILFKEYFPAFIPACIVIFPNSSNVILGLLPVIILKLTYYLF